MLPDRYKLIEEPDERQGHRVFTFVAHETTWKVTQVDRPDDQRSLLSSQSDIPYWPSHHILALDGVVSPAAFADILTRVFSIANHAYNAGYAKRGADIRKAIGI